MESCLKSIAAFWLASVLAGCNEPAAQVDEISDKQEFRIFHGSHTDYGPVFCQGIWIRESEVYFLELKNAKLDWVMGSVGDVETVMSKVQEAMKVQKREEKFIRDRFQNLPHEIETARASKDQKRIEELTIEVERLVQGLSHFLHSGTRSGDELWAWTGGQYLSGDSMTVYLEHVGATHFVFEGQEVYGFVGLKYPFEND
jgi:hypothetical protein